MPQYLTWGSGATSVTLGATRTSDPIAKGQANLVSFQPVAANTDSVGAMGIQSSNDGINWVDRPVYDSSGTLQTSGVAVSSGVAINNILSIPDAAEAHYRFVYTRTSGGASDSLTVSYLTTKGR